MDEFKQALHSRGAALVAFADLSELPPEVRHDLPRAVSIAVALKSEIIGEIGDGPTREYYGEYQRANRLLDELAQFAEGYLTQRGHTAKALAATNVGVDPATLSTRLPHKTVATRAGLGWVGKCALLVTEELGSALRVASVLTDAELPVAEPVNASRCGDCSECVAVCPGAAPSGREWRVGMAREEFYDVHACRAAAREKARAVGIDETICGMCIAVCPWTRRRL